MPISVRREENQVDVLGENGRRAFQQLQGLLLDYISLVFVSIDKKNK